MTCVETFHWLSQYMYQVTSKKINSLVNKLLIGCWSANGLRGDFWLVENTFTGWFGRVADILGLPQCWDWNWQNIQNVTNNWINEYNTYYNNKYILQPQIHITTTNNSFFLNSLNCVFFWTVLLKALHVKRLRHAVRECWVYTLEELD